MSRSSSKTAALILGVIAALIGVAVLASIVAAAVAITRDDGAVVGAKSTSDKVHTIRVSGAGEVLVAPDHATVTGTAEGRHADAETALKRANRRMNKVISAARSAGIAKQDLSTTDVRTYRQARRHDDESEQPPGWVATMTLRIEIDDLALVGPVLSAVNTAGAQRISGPSYSVRDDHDAEVTALEQAIDDARGKAEAAAAEAGVTLGDVVSIKEQSGGGAMPNARYAQSLSTDGGAGIAVTPGEIERIRSSVTVDFRIAQ